MVPVGDFGIGGTGAGGEHETIGELFNFGDGIGSGSVPGTVVVSIKFNRTIFSKGE